jgi:hypothetical protein
MLASLTLPVAILRATVIGVKTLWSYPREP